jgi:uncharacterized protein (UPF0335 family)
MNCEEQRVFWEGGGASGEIRLKETDADRKVRADVYSIAADELRQFLERYEQIAKEKQEKADAQKLVMAEAKARGYDTKVMRKVIAMRKRRPDELAEETAVLDLYLEALGMRGAA